MKQRVLDHLSQILALLLWIIYLPWNMIMFVFEAIQELTIRDIVKFSSVLLFIYIIYHFRNIAALSVTAILFLSLIIPERIKISEKVWSIFSPKIPNSEEFALRFASTTQTYKDGWKGFRRSLLSIIGLLMVVLVIDFSLYADSIAQQDQQESLTGQEVWPIYRDDPETGETLNLYAFKKLPPFSGPKLDIATSSPSDADQRLQLDVQSTNGDMDNDGDLISNLYDLDDDNDGLNDFQDPSPMDFDDDWNETCDSEIWFDNSTGMFCGPDSSDLDDDSDGILDYEEVFDDNSNTNIYDKNNDGIQEGYRNVEGTSISARVLREHGFDKENLVFLFQSTKIPEVSDGEWSCVGCLDGFIESNQTSFEIDSETGQWKYYVYPTNNDSGLIQVMWLDKMVLNHISSSGEESIFELNFSTQRIESAPSISAFPLSPVTVDSDIWYSIQLPENSELIATLSVESGSDYAIYLYNEDGILIDYSAQDNGCPDFYSYDWMPNGFELCPMGTTHTGSDMMSKILYGSRKSLRVGFTVALITCFLGLVIGGISGYYGGRVDEIIMRIADVFFAVPGLILAMAVVTAMDDIHEIDLVFKTYPVDRLEKIMIALIFTGWPGYSRLIRGQVLSVKEHTYIEAARSVGSNDFRILFRHVIPNAWAPMIVAVSLDVGGTILTASGLSFIGLGAEANSAEWGKMISDGRSFFPTQWWMVTFPGIAILVTTLGFNLLGDGLRDVMDPKQRRSKS
jgi:peptide/nickel transport system permease protein